MTGQYSVLLPDGRIQTVTYSVRPETGFVVREYFMVIQFFQVLTLVLFFCFKVIILY